MAKPPEPIEEVMPQATWVLEAVVKDVLKTGPLQPAPTAKNEPGTTSVGTQSPSQTLSLTVTNVLRGPPVKELTVEKPVGAYVLKTGVRGPFLIDAQGHILGRYGPDSWHLDRVKSALSASAKR